MRWSSTVLIPSSEVLYSLVTNRWNAKVCLFINLVVRAGLDKKDKAKDRPRQMCQAVVRAGIDKKCNEGLAKCAKQSSPSCQTKKSYCIPS